MRGFCITSNLSSPQSLPVTAPGHAPAADVYSYEARRGESTISASRICRRRRTRKLGGARHCRARWQASRSPAHRPYWSRSTDTSTSSRRIVGRRSLPQHTGSARPLAPRCRRPRRTCPRGGRVWRPGRSRRPCDGCIDADRKHRNSSVPRASCNHGGPHRGQPRTDLRRLRHVSRGHRGGSAGSWLGSPLVRPQAGVPRRRGCARLPRCRPLPPRDGSIDRAALAGKLQACSSRSHCGDAARLRLTWRLPPPAPPARTRPTSRPRCHRSRAGRAGWLGGCWPPRAACGR